MIKSNFPQKFVGGYASFDLFDYLKSSFEINTINKISLQTIPKGSFIYQAGQKTTHMYEIVKGAVKLGTYNDNGEDTTYDVLAKKEFFGNLKYLNGGFFEFSKTLLDSEIRYYDLTFFKKIINHDAIISDWFHYYLVKRWCEAEEKLVNVNHKDIKAKIDFLKDKYRYNVEDSNKFSYNLYDLLSKKDLGDLIGVTRQTIAKALKKYNEF